MPKTVILVVSHGNPFVIAKLTHDYNAKNKQPLLDPQTTRQQYQTYDDIVTALANNSELPLTHPPVNIREGVLTLTKTLNTSMTERCTKVNRKFDVPVTFKLAHDIFSERAWVSSFNELTYKPILQKLGDSDDMTLLLTHVNEDDISALKDLFGPTVNVFTLETYIIPERKAKKANALILTQLASMKQVTKAVNTFVKQCVKAITDNVSASFSQSATLTSEVHGTSTETELPSTVSREVELLEPIAIDDVDASICTISEKLGSSKTSKDIAKISDSKSDSPSLPKDVARTANDSGERSASNTSERAVDIKKPTTTSTTLSTPMSAPMAATTITSRAIPRDNILSVSPRQQSPCIQTNTSGIAIPGPNNYTLTYSSQNKGVIGETALMELLRSINPRFDVQRTSATGHLADIHVVDYDHNIKYIVESKLKQTIIRADVTKFESDIKTMKSSEKCYKIVGLFLSLQSDTIVGIGTYSITPDVVYLTQSFINKETLHVVFDMIVINHTITTALPTITPQRVQFEIPPHVYDLVAKLRVQMSELSKEHQLYTNILENTKKTDADVRDLLSRVQIKEEFIKLIDTEFTVAIGQADLSTTMNDNVTAAEEERLRQFLSYKGSSRTKKSIMENFPSLATTLGSMTKDAILEKYGPKKEPKKTVTSRTKSIPKTPAKPTTKANVRNKISTINDPVSTTGSTTVSDEGYEYYDE